MLFTPVAAEPVGDAVLAAVAHNLNLVVEAHGAGGVVEDAASVVLKSGRDGNGGSNGAAGVDLGHHVVLASDLAVLLDVNLKQGRGVGEGGRRRQWGVGNILRNGKQRGIAVEKRRSIGTPHTLGGLVTAVQPPLGLQVRQMPSGLHSPSLHRVGCRGKEERRKGGSEERRK